MIEKKDCFLFARITKTHGIDGKIIFQLEEEADWENVEIKTIFLEIDGLLVPFFISKNGFKMKSDSSAIIKLEDINSEKEAKKILKNDVFLPKEEFEIENEENSFLDFLVIDTEEGELGKITEILEFPKHSVFQIMKEEKEILIPVNDVFFKKIDEENKIIYTNLPEGLIDINKV